MFQYLYTYYNFALWNEPLSLFEDILKRLS